MSDSKETTNDNGSVQTGSSDDICTICSEAVLINDCRGVATLQCGHEFHLACIGTTFNAKGEMQCPSCKCVERGRWLYSSGRSSNPSQLIWDFLLSLENHHNEPYDTPLPNMSASNPEGPSGASTRTHSVWRQEETPSLATRKY